MPKPSALTTECEKVYVHPSLWGRKEPILEIRYRARTARRPVPTFNDFMDDLYKKGSNPRCDFYDVILLWGCQAKAETKPINSLEHLENVAKNGDERTFIRTFRNMEWADRPAEDFIQATRLALQAGAHLAAREISSEALSRYPDNPSIQKYARGLAPPKVISRHLPPNPTLRANREWLRTHSVAYRGQWVAIRNGELLDSANSLEELTARIPDRKNILLTKVR